MEPATADPSLLTDTATSDTTGSVGTVAGVETVVSDVAVVIGGVVGSVVESVGRSVLFGLCKIIATTLRYCF